MGKGKIIAGTLAGLIMASGIAGAGYIGYKTIKDRDKTIEDQKITIGQLEDENKISKEKIEGLTKDLSAKVSELAEKDKQIAEKDNLIEENNHKIQTLNNQKTTLLASVAEIDNKLTSTTDAVDVDNLEARKTAILGQIDVLNTEIGNLTNEKTKFEQDVATLTIEKQNLQNQIDTLNSQLSEFEQYVLNIDHTNPVESITIEDTKLGTSATMSNVNITTLKLYAWQNATIKYASVDGSTIKATLNGTSQETDTVTIVGNSNKGASISIGSISVETQEVNWSMFIGGTVNGQYIVFTFNRPSSEHNNTMSVRPNGSSSDADTYIDIKLKSYDEEAKTIVFIRTDTNEEMTLTNVSFSNSTVTYAEYNGVGFGC